ncbi:MAG: helix-turn-helix transcriptional regulator [Planctomycetota bacterium]
MKAAPEGAATAKKRKAKKKTAAKKKRTAKKKPAGKKKRQAKKAASKKAPKKKSRTKKRTVTKKAASKGKPGRRASTWSEVTQEDFLSAAQDSGLNQRQIAELLSVSVSTLHNWRSGKSVPARGKQREVVDLLRGRGGRSTPARRSGPLAPISSDQLGAVTTMLCAYLRSAPGRLSADQLVDCVRQVRDSVTS